MSRLPRALRLAPPAIALLLSCAIGCSGDAPATTAEPPDPSAETDTELTEEELQAEAEAIAEEATATPLPESTVLIYFPAADRNGLIGEYREIFDTRIPGDRVKQIVADLIAGPSISGGLRAVPAGAELRQVYMLDSGVAWLDFSSSLTDRIGGGSMGELLAVYSIVDSIVRNVAEVRRVGILVDGLPLESLNGHLDLRRPLAPDYSLILRPVRADALPARSPGPVRLA